MPCASANCGVRNWKWTYGTFTTGNGIFSGAAWVLVSDCNASGEDYICSGSASPPPGPVSGSCGGAFAAYHAWVCDSPFKVPGVDCQNSGPHEISGAGLSCFDVACTCVDSGGDCGGNVCTPPDVCCDGSCATPAFFVDNPYNCGSCGVVCEPSEACVDGECGVNCAVNNCTWTWQAASSGSGCCRTYECQGSESTNTWVLVDQYKSDVDCTAGDSSTQQNGATYTAWDPGMGMGMSANCDCQCTGSEIWKWTPGPLQPNGNCSGSWSLHVACSFEDLGCGAHIKIYDCGLPDLSDPASGTSGCEDNYRTCGCAGTCSFPEDGPSWVLTTPCPQDCACVSAPDRDGMYIGESVSTACTSDCSCGDEPPDPDPECESVEPLSVAKPPEMMPKLNTVAVEGPCTQEECEGHVSTWMAEASGEPNEEGLYKVVWILLDGCPGACCSDQPTQPEFVKKSTLVDAPCKCGCS